MEKFDDLQVLDLSHNKLGPKGAQNIAKMLEEVKTIKSLILKDCDIRVQGLTYICSALSNEENNCLNLLDITGNQIDDGYLKILLAMLLHNPHIYEIKYDLNKEENIEKYEWFNKKFKDD